MNDSRIIYTKWADYFHAFQSWDQLWKFLVVIVPIATIAFFVASSLMPGDKVIGLVAIFSALGGAFPSIFFALPSRVELRGRDVSWFCLNKDSVMKRLAYRPGSGDEYIHRLDNIMYRESRIKIEYRSDLVVLSGPVSQLRRIYMDVERSRMAD